MQEACEGLNEFQKLQAKEMAKIVVEEIAKGFVCSLHCEEHRARQDKKIYFVIFLTLIAIGEKALEIFKFFKG